MLLLFCCSSSGTANNMQHYALFLFSSLFRTISRKPMKIFFCFSAFCSASCILFFLVGSSETICWTFICCSGTASRCCSGTTYERRFSPIKIEIFFFCLFYFFAFMLWMLHCIFSFYFKFFYLFLWWNLFFSSYPHSL